MSTTVHKAVDPVIDVGCLLAVDLQPLDVSSLRADREEFLQSLARDNTQLLVNDLFKLPTERAEDVVVVALPPPKTILPREKPVPKPRQPTKWENYAKQKNIRKTKRTAMVYDEEAKEYRPRHGYKRVNDEKAVWALPVPEHGDPMEDQFEKRANAKKERVAKNEVQRLRNIARSQKGGLKAVHRAMATDAQAARKAEREGKRKEVGQALSVAKVSTASMGVHDTATPAKGKGPQRPKGKKGKGKGGKKGKFQGPMPKSKPAGKPAGKAAGKPAGKAAGKPAGKGAGKPSPKKAMKGKKAGGGGKKGKGR